MIPRLNDHEIRVLGVLLEKAVVTPDVYPLTLNALTLGCNQKSSREPVMNLTPGEAGRAARDLEEKSLLRREENFRSGIEKFQQRFCNTAYGETKLDAAEYAVVCLLLLRGPQTPGELRARSGRLHEFATNDDVVLALEQLITRPAGALVARLPRQAGRQDHQYVHLFADAIDSAPLDEAVRAAPATERTDRFTELEARVAELEVRLAALEGALGGGEAADR